MIKILHVVPTLGYGGVAKVVCNYNKVIDSLKYKFDFVTHGKVEDYHSELISNGSKIYYFQTYGKLGGKKYLQQIYEQLSIEDYDIIHIHTGDITGLYAKIYKKAGAKKIICHAHTAHSVSKIARIAKIYFRYLACKYSDLRIGCGILAGEYCFGKGNYILLPNSIEYKKFMNIDEKQKSKLKKELNILEDKIILGHVGSFCLQKNHNFLIDIFYELCKNKSNYILLLVGEGPDREKYENKVKKLGLENKVIFLGNRSDVNMLVNIFDVFIFPSLYEGLPVSVVEAQAAGIKCFISDQIDKTVDLGLELITFLSINNGVKEWSDKIESYLSSNKVLLDDKKIVEVIEEKGYDNKKSVLALSRAYEMLYLEK